MDMDIDSKYSLQNHIDVTIIEFEMSTQSVFPELLRNIFAVNHFDNATLIADMEESDISAMEKFMANTLSHVIPEAELEQYFGIFHMKPECFKFSPGQLNTIRSLIAFCRNKQGSEPENGEKSAENLSAIVEVDLAKEAQTISNAVHNWLRFFCAGDAEKLEFCERKFEQLQFDSKLDENGRLFGVMTCFCNSKTKIQKCAKKENGSKRWLYGNIHKHLKIHLSRYPNEADDSCSKMATMACTIEKFE